MAFRGSNINITFDDYKEHHVGIAKDLKYGSECYKEIRKAKTREEVSRVMNKYRHRNDD